eukprot:TRINITY_DN4165_c0_g1::TRINITY_DN4165_c0_g1_i1::g.2038::m.2038 TRINITY_DN4165_c0_g1::TRINITY_DN4165_c0_g1_i1::g.2038  ORF type:complete len:364 (+),score=91.37,sp/Q9LZM3/PPCS2_ARATH/49.25/8e-79,DFP/PF04127.10/2.1e-06,DFP/PF04127.10/2.8e-10,Arch_ATPase/PF01637.13/0.41,Arch_ATPase/PF01637.13/1.1e+03,NAD_binding_10/PF13460.1/0.26,NAD_binding_10/PF13460.1/5.4e+03 TRINITY_DN4165_c0_g1_i1:46-1137(+)
MNLDAVDEFFNALPKPENYEELLKKLQEFVDFHKTIANRRIVLVTSGGTTVPLEKNTVRFIDNFSNGMRGSASAEQFLERGYAVIFLHRRFSLEPYSRQFSHANNCFLDFLHETSKGHLEVSPTSDTTREKLAEVYEKYKKAKEQNLLLKVPFVSVHDYLYFLKEIAVALRPMGDRALCYLAAAVSDYYIPMTSMAEHKIQSSTGPLDLHLDNVPKMLGVLRHVWCPNAYVVSFKLETDSQILRDKAQTSMGKHGMHAVVANILKTRKDEVYILTPHHTHNGCGGDDDSHFKTIRRPADSEIEPQLVHEIVMLHSMFIDSDKSQYCDGLEEDGPDGNAAKRRKFDTECGRSSDDEVDATSDAN